MLGNPKKREATRDLIFPFFPAVCTSAFTASTMLQLVRLMGPEFLGS